MESGEEKKVKEYGHTDKEDGMRVTIRQKEKIVQEVEEEVVAAKTFWNFFV